MPYCDKHQWSFLSGVGFCPKCRDESLTVEQLQDDVRFLLTLVPDWAKGVVPGLDPTFYGTLSADGDQKVVDRVNEIKKRCV